MKVLSLIRRHIRRLLIGADSAQEKLDRFNAERQNTILSKSVDLRCVSGTGVYVGEHSVIANGSDIRSNAWIGPNTYISAATIGEYAAIAPNVYVGVADHDVDRVALGAMLYDDGMDRMYCRPCVIGPNVWLATGVVVRRGVNIGVGAVVGANSFVNQDVEPFTIVAGSPARFIRDRFDKKTTARIMESRWWEQNFAEAKAIVACLEKAGTGFSDVSANPCSEHIQNRSGG